MIGAAFLRCLKRDEHGATLVEFGFVAPVLVLLIVGIFDIAHTQYTSALVNGAMQKAGRDISLETAFASESAIDQRVIDQVSTVTPASATITLQKLSHFDFSDIGQPEDFTDTNGDGICNADEPFEDANDNGQWDANRGQDSIGGARDAVLYTATVSYPRLFPLDKFVPGVAENVSVSASTVLRNQPYSAQTRTTQVGKCP
jgi:Flp pilus assembly protein TadG